MRGIEPSTSPPDLQTYTDINIMLSGYKTSKHNMLTEFVLKSMLFTCIFLKVVFIVNSYNIFSS